MQGRLRKNVGFSLILFAFFFLFEPSYALIDPLPDLIGYTVLCIALINLADINDKIHTAFKAFRKGIVLSVLRLIANLTIDKIFAEGERSVGQLLLVFVFAILELVILIPGYRSLFEGLLSLGMFEGGEAVYYKKSDKGRNATEKTYLLTVVFLIVKNLVCALPEFTSLQTNSGYEFVGIMRILAIIVVAPLSVIWLAHMLAYFVRIKKDADFIAALSQKYLDKASATPDFFTCRALTLGLYTVLGALVLTFDFYVEGVNILPDFFFYGTVLILAVFLRKQIGSRAWITVTSAIGAIFSVVIYVVEKSFFSMFTIEAVIRNFEAYNQYNLLVCLYAVKGIVFVLLTYFVIREIYGSFDRYIGARHESNDSYTAEHGKNLRARVFVCFVLGVLSAISTLYRVLALPYHGISWIYYYSGIISGVIQLAFVASAGALILYLVGEVKYNYKSFL